MLERDEDYPSDAELAAELAAIGKVQVRPRPTRPTPRRSPAMSARSASAASSPAETQVTPKKKAVRPARLGTCPVW